MLHISIRTGAAPHQPKMMMIRLRNIVHNSTVLALKNDSDFENVSLAFR
jgi:hypothetical protein